MLQPRAPHQEHAQVWGPRGKSGLGSYANLIGILLPWRCLEWVQTDVNEMVRKVQEGFHAFFTTDGACLPIAFVFCLQFAPPGCEA